MSSVMQCEPDFFSRISAVKHQDGLIDLQKMHLPAIAAPKSVKKGESFEVTIKVGRYSQHPNEPGHYIEFIELYADNTYLAGTSATGGIMNVSVVLDEVYSRLRAVGCCNLHGPWQGQAEIEVTD